MNLSKIIQGYLFQSRMRSLQLWIAVYSNYNNNNNHHHHYYHHNINQNYDSIYFYNN